MFDSISPLEFRYLKSPEAAKLRRYLSEEALIKYMARVEAALVAAYHKKGLCSAEVAQEVVTGAGAISAAEVYAEENRIHHQVRALVNCIKSKVSTAAHPWIHLGATSHDIICTSEALRYKEATSELLLPLLIKLENTLIDLAEREKKTVQIGRTHGQHAVPTTFGFALAEYVSRLGNRILKIQEAAHNLKGQLSGAVGSYNAQALIVKDPIALENTFLEKLGLKPADHSTQIVEPEYFLDFFHALISAFGVLANLCDDMRHLQRSEINEVAEKFKQNQVGSSTMPHKRNPIHFEHVKSLWKTFMPRMTSLYLDQISEHQRDLTNSASSRFYGEIFSGLYLAALRLNRVMADLVVDKNALKVNLNRSRLEFVAEPMYIILAKNGHQDAHEAVRLCFQEGGDLKQLPISEEEREFLSKPENYIGKAVEKTEQVCWKWRKQMDDMLS